MDYNTNDTRRISEGLEGLEQRLTGALLKIGVVSGQTVGKGRFRNLGPPKRKKTVASEEGIMNP